MSGCWQIDLYADDAEKSNIFTPDGLFQFRCLAFGLCNAPATFQCLIDRSLGPVKWTMALDYLDDIIVCASNFDEHQHHLGLVLIALSKGRLRLKSSTCFLEYDEVTYLGHVVSKKGVRPAPAKLSAPTNVRKPTTIR